MGKTYKDKQDYRRSSQRVYDKPSEVDKRKAKARRRLEDLRMARDLGIDADELKG